MNSNNQNKDAGKRGVTSMDDESQRESARKGGQVTNEKGSANEFSSGQARGAGTQGGRTNQPQDEEDQYDVKNQSQQTTTRSTKDRAESH